ncbi:hypothetical protein O181_047794 [Austropuccinia psidii MF-1]|uniref:Uncharacterized protein n=1 Tax=Austropuccinia psidii MF-1 TaxID=1389203 RepID=A0A9Q3DRQ4_9BASI|nr:hypothetical protein [Austropuccinia psidii MF-1]
MEATIQSNQMDVDKEEARPNPEVASLPQERHIWRMPELSPIPQVFQGQNQFQGAAIDIYQCHTKIGSEQPKKRSGKFAQAFVRGT